MPSDLGSSVKSGHEATRTLKYRRTAYLNVPEAPACLEQKGMDLGVIPEKGSDVRTASRQPPCESERTCRTRKGSPK
jgi:hypothetical protein